MYVRSVSIVQVKELLWFPFGDMVSILNLLLLLLLCHMHAFKNGLDNNKILLFSSFHPFSINIIYQTNYH